MSLPRYPEYKDTGVLWPEQIPGHWSLGNLKRIVSLVESGVSVNAIDEPAGPGALGVLKTSCVYAGVFDPTENKTVVSEDLGRVACPVKAGTLIVSRMNTPALVGAAGLVLDDAPSVFLPDRLWQVHFSFGIPRFIHYWTMTPAYRSQVQMSCAGTSASMQNLSVPNFLVFSLPLPPEDEQYAITVFLVRETSKIDVLIEEQEKLLALLDEKWRAAMSHTVVRGLDPDVVLEDSGVQWLGRIPRGWKMKRLKYLSPAITVGIVVNPSDYVAESGLPFIYGGDISEGVIAVDGARRISAEDSWSQSKTRLEEGDLLCVRVGAPGVTAVVPPECEGGNCASVVLIRRGDFDSDWLCYAMNSRMVRYQVEVVQYGAAQEQFNIAHAVDFWVATPPREEQEQLAKYLRELESQINTLSAEVSRGIEILKERRAALISAAVTGKIDVRGLIEPKEAA